MEMKVVDENDQEVPRGVSRRELVSRMIKGDTKVDYLGNCPRLPRKRPGEDGCASGDMVHKDEKGWFFFRHFRKGSANCRRAGDFIQPESCRSASSACTRT